jgi:hypothetical protein
VVVHVGLPPVLLLLVLVGDVHMVHGGMVVLMGVGRQQMTPVLSAMQIVRHVEVLVPVLHGIVLMMTLRPRHPS